MISPLHEIELGFQDMKRFCLMFVSELNATTLLVILEEASPLIQKASSVHVCQYFVLKYEGIGRPTGIHICAVIKVLLSVLLRMLQILNYQSMQHLQVLYRYMQIGNMIRRKWISSTNRTE